MSDATDRARELLIDVQEVGIARKEWTRDSGIGKALDTGLAALDCLEAHRGPRWKCDLDDCGRDFRSRNAAVFHRLRWGHNVVEIQAGAWEKFKEPIGE